MNDKQTVHSYYPDYLVTPGEVLEEYLEHEGLTQASLADRTGLSKKTINEIVKAKAAITAETALKLERTLGRPAHFWSNLERQYQEDKTRLADKIHLEESLHWLEIFPVNKMARYGWIEKCKDKIVQLDMLLRYFAVASPAQWEAIWGRELQVCFRKRESSKKDIAIISAWLRRGEIEAEQQRCAPFDKQKLQDSLVEIRKLTTIAEPSVFIPKLEAICAVCGVALICVPALPKLGIYGATRWLNHKYIMQLSLYGKSNDHLWFTVFHELCHIIKHSRRECFIEGGGPETDKETEANAFASDMLIPPKYLKRFLAPGRRPTIVQIEQFAVSIGIAPGIVVGRLQHDKIIPMSWGNELKVRYEWMREWSHSNS
ncbi:MAG: HigA family addiction module antidote protein [Spirochaetaceae bacterium]|jgi:addiction module HigA family antidote|nr:HigA family addiction module antidote protein [Spirochaetaceae bacterium]